MHNRFLYSFVFLAILGYSFGFTGTFIPKSFYTIDKNGHRSETIYLAMKDDPVGRFRRSPSEPSSGSSSGAFSSSFASSSAGSTGNFNPADGAIFFNDNEGCTCENPLQGIINAVNSLQNQFVPSANPAFYGSTGGDGSANPNPGPVLFSRSGEGVGSGISASAKSQGQRGAFSSSSTSVDSNGKVKYSVQAGKF